MAKVENKTKVITNLVRFSYLHVFEKVKQEGDTDSDGKYSVSLIIPKSDKETIKCIREAINNAKESAIKEKWNGKNVAVKESEVLHDGDEERPEDSAYANSYFLSAKCNTQPGLIDAYKNEITDSRVLYSGCYGRASVTIYGFNVNGKKGIAVGLNNLQKLKEGEPLGGRASAQDDFDDDEALKYIEDEDL